MNGRQCIAVEISSELIKIQCLQREVCQNEPFLCRGISFSRRAMTGHQTWGYGQLLYLWKAVWSVRNWHSSWAHFLTCQERLQKRKNIPCFHKMAVVVAKKGREKWKSQTHSLLCYLVYQRLTHPTHPVWHLQKVSRSQSNCEYANQVHRALWSQKFTKEQELNARVKLLEKAAQKIGQKGTLFPPQQAGCPKGSQQAAARWKEQKWKHDVQKISHFLIVSSVFFNR